MVRSRKALSCLMLGGALLLAAPRPQAWAARLTTLHAFTDSPDGGLPYDPVIYKGGQLYGTTYEGGAGGYGAVFRVDAASGAEAVIYSFPGGGGNFPFAKLLACSGQWLYGTTFYGGLAGAGTIFKFKLTTENLVTLHVLDGGSAGPMAGLVGCGEPELYGTTSGFLSDPGTVFAINRVSGALRLLHRFDRAPDGNRPTGELIEVGGILYGTTIHGGIDGKGTVFAVDPATGVETVLYRFLGGSDGAHPAGGLVYRFGTFYGVTSEGGGSGRGSVFAIDATTHAETVLHGFAGGPDGKSPNGGLVALDGFLYGATSHGGKAGLGTIFKVEAATGAETVLHSFSGGAEGAYPFAGLTQHGGVFYGTTFEGGAANAGTVFRFVP